MRKPKRGQTCSGAHDACASPPPAVEGRREDSISDGHRDCEAHVAVAIAADDHNPRETHDSLVVGPYSNSDGHSPVDAQKRNAVTADDHAGGETPGTLVVGSIREAWRNRQAWHRAEKSLTLQGKAQCRRFTHGDKAEANRLFAKIEKFAAGDDQGLHDAQSPPVIYAAILPFIEARTSLVEKRKVIERELSRMAKTLPVWEWCEDIYGFGPLSLAAIVGEAGDLSEYSNPAKLWKRMGLAVVNGERQRKKGDAIAALEHGFAPHRAAVMFNISGQLIGGMGHGPRPVLNENIDLRDDLSPYQRRFIQLVRKEVERVTPTWNGPDHKREPVDKKGDLYESYSSHAANRARRRVGKEFLCDLLVAWKAQLAVDELKPTEAMPIESLIAAEAA